MAMPESTFKDEREAIRKSPLSMRCSVGVVRLRQAKYPGVAPFHPDAAYPEYPFGGAAVGKESNLVYDGVRRLLRDLGYDSAAFGTASWNPLASIVEPGMCVVIKPNFVLSHHADGHDLFSIITHPSVLRAVMDYVWIALKNE